MKPESENPIALDVLGAALCDDTSAALVFARLQIGDFRSASGIDIFAAAERSWSQTQHADLPAVARELALRGRLEAVGGRDGLVALVEQCCTTAATSRHVETLLVLRRRRSVGAALAAAAAKLRDENEPIEQCLAIVTAAFASTYGAGRSVPYQQAVSDAYREIGERRDGAPPVAAFGFHALDAAVWLRPGDLVTLGGRPGVGKSALALNACENAAEGTPKRASLYLQTEMRASAMATRTLSRFARIRSQLLDRGLRDAPPDAWDRLATAASRASVLDIEVRDDTRSQDDLLAAAEAAFATRPRAMVVVDHVQALRLSGSRTDQRHHLIGEAAKSWKAFALRHGCVVLMLSQLNRECEQRRPTLSDLRECVPGDTLVALADGRRIPIRRLIGTTPEVSTVRRGRIGTAMATRVWSVGKRETLTIRLASGRRLSATKKHRVLTGSGWTRVSSLRSGMRVAIARMMPEPSSTLRWPDLRVALLGQLIGDGSYLSNQPLRYTTASEANSAIVSRAAREEFGATVRRYAGRRTWHQLMISGNGNKWHPAGVNLWLRKLGVFGQRSYQKRVPEECFRLATKQVALLLRHLWATDGTISRRSQKDNVFSVSYSTTSRGLADDVAALLLRCGVVARIYSTRKGSYRPSYNVTVTGGQQRNFASEVGAFGDRTAKLEALKVYLASTRANTNVDTLPNEVFRRVRNRMRVAGITTREMQILRGVPYGGQAHFTFAPSRALVAGYATLLGDDELREAAHSDLFWDRVVGIEPRGTEEVFDLSVPESACWLADSIVSHNSGDLEQDSDVILLLHRPRRAAKARGDVVIPENDLLEIGVAKNRNGESGGVFTLMADLAHSTFSEE